MDVTIATIDSMPRQQKKRFILHSKTPAFKKKIQRTLTIIEDFLDIAENPYIAVSGGKDSSVLLHLCRRIRPSLDAVHLDFHTAFPETLALFETYENLKFVSVGSRLEMLAEGGMHDTSDKGKLRNFTPERIRAEGYDGWFYGLRREENPKKRGKHLQVHGDFFQKKDGLHVCQPIARLQYIDVWAYIVVNEIQYNELYDGMWHLPENQQRVADYALVKNANRGTVAQLKKTHPHLFNKIVKHTKEFREYL